MPLTERRQFGKKTVECRAGLKWFEYRSADRKSKLQHAADASRSQRWLRTTTLCSTVAATYSSSTAPVIKLPADATEDDHYALLAYLNSSTACFWMKQVAFPKTSGTNVGEMRGVAERVAYQFSGTALGPLPVPRLSARLSEMGRLIVSLAQARHSISPSRSGISAEQLAASRLSLEADAIRYDSLHRQMVVLQEEIDWEVYTSVDLCPAGLLAIDQGLTLTGLEARPNDRPFCEGLPLSPSLAELWHRRRTAIGQHRELALIEQRLFKRPWLGVQGVFHRDGWTYDELLRVAMRRALCQQLEELFRAGKAASTLRRLHDTGSEVASLIVLSGPTTEAPRQDTIATVLSSNAVPYLAAYRFSDSGMFRWANWESTWEAQRREDGGTSEACALPGKYAVGDFRDPAYYSLRGQLDVPKERFISYPGCESDDDGEPVYGWAGWDHLQRAQALANLYMDRKTREGWPRERLLPMLAGLLELIPWVKQWHNEPSAEYDGLRMGDYFAQFLDGELRLHALTTADLRAWRPAKRTRGKAKPTTPRPTPADSAPDSAAPPAPKPKRPRKPKAPVVE
jgi:hypothetical protein